MKAHHKLILFLLLFTALFSGVKAESYERYNFYDWNVSVSSGFWDSYGATNVDAGDLDNVKNEIYQQYLTNISSRKTELQSGSITIGNTTMKFSMERIGFPGKNGFPVYIALRGGGVGDAAVRAVIICFTGMMTVCCLWKRISLESLSVS